MRKNRGLFAVVVALPVLLFAAVLVLAAQLVGGKTTVASRIELPESAPEGAEQFDSLQGETATSRGASEAESAARWIESEDAAADLGATTILLAGSHEENTDTLMLARLDSDENLLSLLSVPRDLYVGSHRINAIYAEEGIEALRRAIAGVTGTEIDHHIATDMYAFMDAIDLLGGITVTLDEALHDPTYVVEDDGNRSTLWLPAGTHHLNGRETLRYVRSRHTTSDFDRARRQQEVLHALRDRMNELGFRDIGVVAKFAGSAIRYVSTDMSLIELVRYASALRDVESVRGTVMSTDNVLEATYSALYANGSKESDGDAGSLSEDELGAWILVPKADDWAAVRRFAHASLAGDPDSAGD